MADYNPFLTMNVSVNGLKRCVSDTGGMIIPLMHIPLAGPSAMAAMIGHESMNFFASQMVFCDGVRMSPKGYMVTCKNMASYSPPQIMLKNITKVYSAYPKIATFED